VQEQFGAISSERSSCSAAKRPVSTVTDALRVGVFFGSRSVEHEVSCHRAAGDGRAAADRFVPVPVYIAKSGAWYTGRSAPPLDRYRDIDRLIAASTRVTMRPDPTSGGELIEVDGRRGLLGGSARAADRFDVAMPLVHGSNGEDGTLQGTLRAGRTAVLRMRRCVRGRQHGQAALANHIARRGYPGARRCDGLARSLAGRADAVCADLARRPGCPMYVKPRRLGSSIGVARVETDEALRTALEVAFGYDTSILAEAAQDGGIEINCSVLGSGDDVQASVCEQPVSSGTLSYADKYLSGAKGKGASRNPRRDEELAANHPRAHLGRTDDTHPGDCDGVLSRDRRRRRDPCRFPRLSGPRLVLVNELNTLPGSLSFYLWEPSGVHFDALLTRLIDMAIAAPRAAGTTSSIDTWLLHGSPG